MSGPSLYAQLAAAGVKMTNHESDLYCEATPEAIKIITVYEVGLTYNLSRSFFLNAVTRTTWVDIPFHFDPWWHARGIR